MLILDYYRGVKKDAFGANYRWGPTKLIARHAGFHHRKILAKVAPSAVADTVYGPIHRLLSAWRLPLLLFPDFGMEVLPVFAPADRIGCDVFADVVQFRLIPDNMFVTIRLTNGCARDAAHFVNSFDRYRFGCAAPTTYGFAFVRRGGS